MVRVKTGLPNSKQPAVLISCFCQRRSTPPIKPQFPLGFICHRKKLCWNLAYSLPVVKSRHSDDKVFDRPVATYHGMGNLRSYRENLTGFEGEY